MPCELRFPWDFHENALGAADDPNPQDALRISTGYNISTLEEIEKEDKDNRNDRGGSLKNIITPLKDLL